MASNSLRARIAKHRCQSLIERNMHVFSGCSELFIGRLMMALQEVQLMPKELILKHGDMARHLSAVSLGTLEVIDANGGLVELISGAGTTPCLVGTVSFLMGAPPATLAAP